jgi:hypothetical protein
MYIDINQPPPYTAGSLEPCTIEMRFSQGLCNMEHIAHSDWMFDHSLSHHLNTSADPHSTTSTDTSQITQQTQTDPAVSVAKALWHHTDGSTGGGALATQGSSGSPGSSNAGSSTASPALKITANALTVNAGGSVALPVSVSSSNSNSLTSVTISGLANYETVTDHLDGKTFTPDANGSMTLSAAEVNSGLTLASSYTGTGQPTNTLTVTATETIGHHSLTSASQTIAVTDPPATTGSATSGAASSSGNTLSLQVSGDQYNGDPQIEVFVDGQQIGGTYTVTADHASGQTQTITITGNFDPTVAHQVQVQFVNDAWDGTNWSANGGNADGHDRNVYVESIALNGETLNGGQGSNAANNGAPDSNSNEAFMNVNGTLTFNVPADPPASTGASSTGTSGSGSSTSSAGTTGGNNTLTLQVSGDQYKGDPQIEAFVDGQQVGGTYTVTADHWSGQTQTIAITGNFDPSVAHQVQVKFVNDAWDGTDYVGSPDGHDRNVYVESITLNGETLNGGQGSNAANNGAPDSNSNEAFMNVNGTLTFNVPADPPASTGASSTGTSGSGSSTSSSTSTSPSSGTSTDSSTSNADVGTGAPDPAQTTDAFYVSPNGNDSNPGTLAGPFATLAHAQQAMENSSIKTTYVEGGTYHLTSGITLTAADSGETWQYYAPDGVNSAVLDGGGSVNIFTGVDASNITIDGLKMQNFATWGVELQSSSLSGSASNETIENCDIGGNTTFGNPAGAVILSGNIENSLISHNYIHNTIDAGIEVFDGFTYAGNVNGVVITGNVLMSTNQQTDPYGSSAAIYLNFHAGSVPSDRGEITNNYISDVGNAANLSSANDIGFDTGVAGFNVTGNILGAPAYSGTNGAGSVSGGQYLATGSSDGHDNTWSGNIIDLGSSGTAMAFMSYYDGILSVPMTNEIFQGNIIISSFSGASMSGSIPDPYYESTDAPGYPGLTIQHNVYYNYASGGSVFTNGDSSPINENPQISGDLYTIAANSPVFNSPVNFAPIVGGWGPQGFVIPSSTNHSDP